MMKRQHQHGFTLVEMIMAIVITGIVAGIVAVFIARPVEGYIASARRADLTDMADLALKQMALEIRTAVPNSVRVTTDLSGNHFLEFIPTLSGGRYCTDSDTDAICTANPLLFSGSDTSFAVLGPSPSGSNNDWLVIYNTNTTNAAQNAYQAPSATSNRRQLSPAPGSTVSFSTYGYDSLHFSESRRFQIVEASGTYNSGPVTFACESQGGTTNGSGFLNRYTNYGFLTSQPTSGMGAASRVAGSIQACQFTYGQISGTNGLVTVSLTLRQENESVTLMYQIHVDNMP